LKALDKANFMNIDQRKKVIDAKLLDMGETFISWANKNGLHQRIATDLIDGKLRGTRGVALENRQKMEITFGLIFDD